MVQLLGRIEETVRAWRGRLNESEKRGRGRPLCTAYDFAPCTLLYYYMFA